MKAIVIGGSGYLGRRVVDVLLREGHTVSIVGRDARPPGIPQDVTVHQGDASNLGRAQWEPILAGHDALVFAAGVDSRCTPPRPSSVFFHRHNVHAVTRMMHAARHAGITRAVIHNSYMVTIARDTPSCAKQTGIPTSPAASTRSSRPATPWDQTAAWPVWKSRTCSVPPCTGHTSSPA